MSRRTLLEEKPTPLWVFFVGVGVVVLLVAVAFGDSWPRTWSEDRIREIAREECRALTVDPDAGTVTAGRTTK